MVSKPDEKIGKQILEWLDRGQQLLPATNAAAPAQTPIFNESGFLTGEKETKAMLDAIQKAATIERLDSIDQSRQKGLSTKKLTEDQAKQITDAIAAKRSQLPHNSQTKAA
ncbi:MAG: hypothetical protein NTU47_00065 [Ignavibacteriales bacterium]|nr:hypothetical protein [Ignavibacteriales bacterium]